VTTPNLVTDSDAGKRKITCRETFNLLCSQRDFLVEGVTPHQRLANVDLSRFRHRVAASWDVSTWYWMANVHNQPGVSDGHFGATTK